MMIVAFVIWMNRFCSPRPLWAALKANEFRVATVSHKGQDYEPTHAFEKCCKFTYITKLRKKFLGRSLKVFPPPIEEIH
jgi:hypothetical protein